MKIGDLFIQGTRTVFTPKECFWEGIPLILTRSRLFKPEMIPVLSPLKAKSRPVFRRDFERITKENLIWIMLDRIRRDEMLYRAQVGWGIHRLRSFGYLWPELDAIERSLRTDRQPMYMFG